MTARTPDRSRGRGEQGSTLVIMLVFLVIVGLSGAAVLGLQGTAFKAQTVYRDRRAVDAASRNVVNRVVEWASPNDEFGRDDANLTTGCNNRNASTEVVPGVPFTEEIDGQEVDVVVTCEPEDESGWRGGGNSELPESVVVTLGGAAGDGDDNADAADAGLYCDDWHARASGQCETGLYVGRADPTLGSEGGFLIAGNGGQNDNDIVRSNSGVIVREGGDQHRVLKVTGGVWARRGCSGTVRANWDLDPETGDYTDADNSDGNGGHFGDNPTCGFNADKPAENPAPYQAGLMTAESLMRFGTTADCAAWIAAGTTDCFDYQPRVDEILGLRTEPADAALPADERRMVAKEWPAVGACANTGYVVIEPGYYDELVPLNNLMNDCGDTLFHFLPGTYYFDFLDADPATWTEPKGANGKLSQIVGGVSPPVTPAVNPTTGWLPCNSGQPNPPAIPPNTCPRQPEHTMDFNLQSNSTLWDVNNAYQEVTQIDGDFGPVAGVTASASNLKWNDPQVKIPERIPGTSVQSLSVDIAHKATDVTSRYETWTLSGFPQQRAPQLWIIIDSNTCKINLQQDPDSEDPQQFLIFKAPGMPGTVKACDWQTAGWAAKMTQLGAQPAWVNAMRLEYHVSAEVNNQTVKAEVDGVRARVVYTGRPAPELPGGCHRGPGAAGVQFVFGGTSRMNYNNNNAFVELCGFATRGGFAGDEYAIALYGMHEAEADPPRFYRSDDDAGFDMPGENYRYPDPARVPANPVEAAAYAAADVGRINGPSSPVLDTGPWVSVGDTRLEFKTLGVNDYDTPPLWPATAWTTRGDAVVDNGVVTGVGADAIPEGSVITGVEVRVRHAEGDFNNPNPALRDDPINNVQLVLLPGNGGVGSNKKTASQWSGYLPICTDQTMPMNDLACNWRYGEYESDYDYDGAGLDRDGPNPCWPHQSTGLAAGGEACAAMPPGETIPKNERSLLDAFSTPEAFDGATVRYEVHVGTGTKQSLLDGIELEVWYRPPGTLRPLSGCLTLRAGVYPGPQAQGGADLVGADRDWGARALGRGDDAYTLGNVNDDTLSCALVRMISSSSSGVKLHIQGMIYAPTAAIDLSGKDNEAPFVTDGLIVRHLTAWRWRKGPNLAALGEQASSREDRVMIITTEVDGHVVDRVKVEFDDGAGVLPGGRVHVREWLHRPEN